MILGCTHYGVLEQGIKKIVEKKVEVVNEGKIVAQKLKDYLSRHPEIEQKLGKNSKIKFYTTDLTDKFKTFGSKFFGRKIIPEKVELE